MDDYTEYLRSTISLIGEILVNYIQREGILDEINLRDIKIRYDFKQLISQGLPKQKALKVLSAKIHYTTNNRKYSLSIRALQKITRTIKIPSSGSKYYES